MRRLIAVLLAVLALTALAAAPVAAGGPHGPRLPSRIDLPDGWRPEGIAAGRRATLFAGSLADGAIARVDLRTGRVDDDFIPGETGRTAVGVYYERHADRLWVAGGPTGEVRAYDGFSGDLLETYTFEAGFINDLVVTWRGVYATDSMVQQLLVIPFGRGRSLPGPEDAFARPITGDFVYADGFNANGIESRFGRLIVPQSNTGALFAINPATGASRQLLPAGSVTFADGLRFVGNRLYVVRNQLNRVDVYRFGWFGRPTFVGRIKADGLDVPTTIAFAAGRLWVVNARFSTPPAADTAYWITRLPTR